jgi:hypothetical protein
VLTRPVLAVMFAGIVLGSPVAMAQETPSIDGTWEGIIDFDKSQQPFDDMKSAKTRMELHGSDARVFVYEKDKPVEIAPGKFQVVQHGPNAVIFASMSEDSFPHKEQSEMLSYTVTRQWDGSLLVEYARVGQVSRDEMLSAEIANFGARGEGVLKRLDNRR